MNRLTQIKKSLISVVSLPLFFLPLTLLNEQPAVAGCGILDFTCHASKKDREPIWNGPGTVGYFSNRGTVYYRAYKNTPSDEVCAFSRPGHLQIFQAASPDRSYGERPLDGLKNNGICNVPESYFSYKGTAYYTSGVRVYCGFRNPAALAAYKQRWNRPDAGELRSDPKEFMTYKGACP